MDAQVLTAVSPRRVAQLLSMISVTLMPAFPILLIWGGASILVYALSAHYPNPIVREYIHYSGYRFYGLAGTLLVLLTLSNELKKIFVDALHMRLEIWAISFLIVVPLGLHDVWRASREEWRDIQVENI